MRRAKGRMLNQDISTSDKIASLPPKSLALFFLLIPHFNAHGKQHGGPGHIKDIICPKITWLTQRVIANCLQEISEKTNVKWFNTKGVWYLHALNWSEHQDLKEDRKGLDLMPDFNDAESSLGAVRDKSGISPAQKVKVKVKVEGQVEGEGEGTTSCSSGEAEQVVDPQVMTDFDKFWEAYPRKVGKLQAEKAWHKLKPPLSKVLFACQQAVESSQWRKNGGEFIPHPATWLNRGGWEDDYRGQKRPFDKLVEEAQRQKEEGRE
ncbi:hypothetical protein LCGC14_1356520 [marine sediment metagenome]|uniref:Bacteriophage lambda Replication protein O N-terminal domain-containing protein n=1 Tax=marine sediment metagenome TaxID=412755 RepID=A0A0F9K9C6_9ZZZZ